MGNMINLLEQEIIDLKNQNKTRQMRTGLGDDGSPDQSIASRIDLLIEEINQLWSFVQRFIDEHATDMIQEVRSGDTGFRSKMQRMDWLARNAEFLSPD